MKKEVISICIIFMLIFIVFTGCNESNNDSNNADEQNSNSDTSSTELSEIEEKLIGKWDLIEAFNETEDTSGIGQFFTKPTYQGYTFNSDRTGERLILRDTNESKDNIPYWYVTNNKLYFENSMGAIFFGYSIKFDEDVLVMKELSLMGEDTHGRGGKYQKI